MQVELSRVVGEVDGVDVPRHLFSVGQGVVVAHAHVLRGEASARPHVPGAPQGCPLQLVQLLHPLRGLDVHLADDVPAT